MSIESKMVGYYAQRAKEYERIYEKPERQDNLRALQTFIERTFSGKHVLEVACGTGYWTAILSRSAASITAIDINEAVLEIARTKPLDRQKVSFQPADAYALPAFARGFTAGLAAFWWSHIPRTRLRPFLSGLHRAFASGSTLVFIDNTYVEGSSSPISTTDVDGNTYQSRTLEDGSTHVVLKNFPTEAEIRHTLSGIASNVEVEFLKYYWTLAYVPQSGS